MERDARGIHAAYKYIYTVHGSSIKALVARQTGPRALESDRADLPHFRAGCGRAAGWWGDQQAVCVC